MPEPRPHRGRTEQAFWLASAAGQEPLQRRLCTLTAQHDSTAAHLCSPRPHTLWQPWCCRSSAVKQRFASAATAGRGRGPPGPTAQKLPAHRRCSRHGPRSMARLQCRPHTTASGLREPTTPENQNAQPDMANGGDGHEGSAAQGAGGPGSKGRGCCMQQGAGRCTVVAERRHALERLRCGAAPRAPDSGGCSLPCRTRRPPHAYPDATSRRPLARSSSRARPLRRLGAGSEAPGRRGRKAQGGGGARRLAWLPAHARLAG